MPDKPFESVLTEEEIRTLAADHFPRPGVWWAGTWKAFLAENPDAFLPFARAVEQLIIKRILLRLIC